MPSEKRVTVEDVMDACAADPNYPDAPVAVLMTHIASAIEAAHAAGEEKGRREMREACLALVKEEHKLALRFNTNGVGAAGRLHSTISEIPTTPPTPNPLPATGGEEE